MNLSNYIRSKIYNHCFDEDENLRILKLNNEEINISDLILYSKTELKIALDDQLIFLLEDISSNKEICYDEILATIFKLYHDLKIPYDNLILEKIAFSILEKEKYFPFHAISRCLIFIFVNFIKDDFYSIEEWQKLYYNENNHLKFVFGCGILKYDFDIDIYSDMIMHNPFYLTLNLLLQCKILPAEEISKINNSLPEKVNNKIFNDCLNLSNDNVVLNWHDCITDNNNINVYCDIKWSAFGRLWYRQNYQKSMSEKALVSNRTWDNLSQVLDFSKFNFQNKNKNTKLSYFYSLWDFCKFLSKKLQIPLDEENKEQEINKFVIKEFIKLNSNNEIEALQVKAHVVEYLNNLLEKKQATSTIAAKFAAIRDFFESISDIYKIDFSNIKAPKIEKKKIKGPKPEEFEKLISEINNLFEEGSYIEKRNCLIFYLENFCGLRISEVLSIDIEEIDLKEGSVFVFRKGTAQYQKVSVNVPSITLEKLKKFLELDGRKQGPLFVNTDKPHKPGRLSRQSAHTIFCELTEKFLNKKYSPHKFRHFYATEAWKITKNKDLAMKFTGHKTSAVFDNYEEDESNYHLQIANDLEKKWIK